ncbi:SMI1/KNR4 family protein [Hymenobacter arizonensis]|uniref:Knr4/Smi1-like domain-containing protein n=1 Tax=Hymenobacter arizonensis TaxID=1227077 RepID=A0A1I5SUC9_HYMAR|nr:SMI1/KNR4 family protein [Hymenobacter arizonensis]SFP74365.1 hypothetical protein SAMN04515668_0198 [Hymenobacter arizonensis]
MVVPQKVKNFLARGPGISLGYNEITFFAPESLEQSQVGYRVDADGNSLITGEEGAWQEEWLVIGNDGLGDPIIVDTSNDDLMVLSAMHGEGSWESYAIADTLVNFQKIIHLFQKVSEGRAYPDELKNNPISESEIEIVLKSIEKQNPGFDLTYWEILFENE